MHLTFMKEAIRLAVNNVKQGGEPFGAVVVRGGEIIARGVNEVDHRTDPTAHAELLAIREASQVLQKSDLSDCVLYASGEPCPMCLGAIYWANLKEVYYAYSIQDASAVGLSSAPIYDQVCNRSPKTFSYEQLTPTEEMENPLSLWQRNQLRDG